MNKLENKLWFLLYNKVKYIMGLLAEAEDKKEQIIKSIDPLYIQLYNKLIFFSNIP